VPSKKNSFLRFTTAIGHAHWWLCHEFFVGQELGLSSRHNHTSWLQAQFEALNATPQAKNQIIVFCSASHLAILENPWISI